MNILITAPSLDPKKNVSGISTVVTTIIENGTHSFFHYKLGSEDNKKKGLIWALTLLFAYVRLPFYLCAKRIAVVHQNIPLDAKGVLRESIVCFIAKLCNKKVVAHLHGGKFLTEGISNNVLLRLTKFILRKSDCVIVLSELEQKKIVTLFDFSNTIVLRNCIKVPHISVLEKANVIPQILYLGRLDINKGLEEIVVALQDLSKEVPFRFVVCGDGPDKTWFLQHCSQILNINFSYKGVVAGQAKVDIISQSTIFILPSYFEGLPMALLETMSYGLIPVVTPVGSIPEVVIDGQNGILVEKQDTQDLYLKLKTVIENKDLMLELSKNARSTIMEHYNITSYISSLDHIYEEIMLKKS